MDEDIRFSKLEAFLQGKPGKKASNREIVSSLPLWPTVDEYKRWREKYIEAGMLLKIRGRGGVTALASRESVEGYSAGAKEGKSEQARRGLEFEQGVRDFLSELGLHDVCGGQGFRLGGYQVDAAARYEDTAIIVECVTAFGRRKLDFRTEITNIRGKMPAIRKGLAEDPKFSRCTDSRFVLATNSTPERGDFDFAYGGDKVYLWSKESMDYYRELWRRLDQFSRNGLLAELDIKPQFSESLIVPCFKIELNGLQMYQFFIEPKKLLSRTFVARREVPREDYYQRMVQTDRLRKIAYYVTKERGVFPNNIVVAFDDEPNYTSIPEARERLPDSWPEWLDYGILRFPQSFRACWIVDGQHRLLSFTKVQETDLKLPVVALGRIPPEEQAKYFLDINSKQKPVPPDLVWDLQGTLRPDQEEGIISRLAKKLNELEAFKGRIYIPSHGMKSPRQLRLSGICNTIKRRRLVKGKTENMTQKQDNPLYDRDSERLIAKTARALNDYFLFLIRRIPEPLGSEFLMQNTGVSIFISLYERIISFLERVPTEGELEGMLGPFIAQLNTQYAGSKEIHELRLRCNSEGGRDEVTDDFVNMINELTRNQLPTSARKNEELNKQLVVLEKGLREFLNRILSEKDRDWLRTRVPGAILQELRDRARAKGETDLLGFLGLGDCAEIIKRDDNWDTLKTCFLDKTVGFDSKEATLVALRQVTAVRNDIFHGRPIKWKFGDRKIFDANLEKLFKIVGKQSCPSAG